MSDYLSGLFSLTGRVAIVTGGSSGIGQGMAVALARAGAQVVLIARDARRLEESAAALRAQGGQAAWVSADLGDRAAVGARPRLRPRPSASRTSWSTARGSTCVRRWRS